MENSEEKIPIIIEKKPRFTENWHEGHIMYKGEQHMFWLIDPQGSNYEMSVQWFFRDVPREVRAMQHLIIEAFKQEKE